MDPFVGQLLTLPFNWAPEGWASCTGQVISTAQSQALFALIGDLYGGNGSSTFGLPNLQGRTVVGAGVDANGTNWAVGASGGSPTTTLTLNHLPQHTHDAAFTPSTPPSPSATVAASVTGFNSSVALSATYNAVSATGATGVPSAGASLGIANPGATKLYTSVAGTAVPIGTVTATGNLTGTLSVDTTGSYPTAGGSVLLGATGQGLPFSIVPPFVSLNVVIAMNGIFPPRP